MEFPLWALKKIRSGDPVTVVVNDWGTPMLPLETLVIEAWGAETTWAAYFSAAGRIFEHKYKTKSGICKTDFMDDTTMIWCREVVRRERVVWEYEAVEPGGLPARHLN